MYVIAKYTEGNEPKTGLSCIVYIRNCDTNSITVNSAAMSEIGGGNYKYDWNGYVSSNDYIIDVDGGSELNSDERYQMQIIQVDPYGVVKCTLTG